MRKVIGLEMEASAIGAIGHLQNIKAIVMKAVMDFADPAKADNFKAFAARASAECLIAFLRANLEPAEPGFDDILETGISEKPKNPSPAQMLNARYRFVPLTLIGGEGTRGQAKDLLNRLEGQADESMLSLLHDLYPGASQGADRLGYVGYLEPDLLGEAMVFRTLQKEDDGAEALLHHIFQGRTEDVIRNGLIVLGRVSLVHEERIQRKGAETQRRKKTKKRIRV